MTFYELCRNATDLDLELIKQVCSTGGLTPITLEDIVLGPIAGLVGSGLTADDLEITYDEGYDAGILDAAYVGNDIEVALAPLFKRVKDGNYIGIGTGPGWWPLLLKLDSRLAITDPDYTIGQVKEKFGTLRFYTGPLTEAGRALVQAAEAATATTCEECGKPGTLDASDYWMKTLCEAHQQLRAEKRNAQRAEEAND